MRTPPFPAKRYRVIYADPPWPIKKVKRSRAKPKESPYLDYPVLSVDAIARLPVADIAKERAVLFLWATHTYLFQAMKVMRAWGFKYHCVVTWNKHHGLCFYGFHRRTEFLLVGFRGKMDMYPERKAFPTLIDEESG